MTPPLRDNDKKIIFIKGLTVISKIKENMQKTKFSRLI